MVITEFRKRVTHSIKDAREEVASLKREHQLYRDLGLLLLGATFSSFIVIFYLGGSAEQGLFATRTSAIAFILDGFLGMSTEKRISRLEKKDSDYMGG